MRKTPVALVVFILISSFSFVQAQSLPKSLLWSISGKDLKEPSYLYGTMHLQDKRLFRFPDSLYYFMEHANSYYMEIDAQEALEMMMKEMMNPDSSEVLSKVFSEEILKKYSSKLEKEFGIPAAQITKKQLWVHNISKQNDNTRKDMPVAMDIWFYNIAKRQGKKVGGIENVSEQMAMVADIFSNPASMGNGEDKNTENYIATYMDADLDGIEKWTAEMDTADRKFILDDRNIKMAKAMDSLAAKGSCFFAVGAGHLPGNAGLIKLLRSYGYTVRPVFSKKKIEGNDYHYKSVDLPWITDADKDSTYLVDFPSKPVSFNMFGDVVPMKCAVDIGNGLFYFAAQATLSVRSKTDSALLNIAHNTGDDIEDIKKITVNGHPGYQFVSRKQGYYYKCRIIDNGNEVIIIMGGSEKKSSLVHADIERFFNSLVIKKQITELAADANWFELTEPENGLSIWFPGKPAPLPLLTTQVKNQLGKAWEATNQVYVDNRTGIYYMFFNRKTTRGYYIESNKKVFDEIKTAAENGGRYKDIKYDSGYFRSMPALWTDATDISTGMKVKMLQVIRDNRVIAVFMIGDKDKLTDSVKNKFFNSLTFTPYLNENWSAQTVTAAGFHTTAPSGFEWNDTSGTSPKLLTSFDRFANVSYSVQIETMPEYFWMKNDSGLFEEKKKLLSSPGSIITEKNVLNGNLPGKELIIEKEGVASRYRLIRNADTLYVLTASASGDFIKKQTDEFFNSFRADFIKTTDPVLVNKTSLLLKDIFSEDSATSIKAKEYLDEAPFTKDDLPLLHQALLSAGRYYSENTRVTPYWHVADRVAKLADSSTVVFIQQNLSTIIKNELAFPVSIMLAKMKTKESYALLAEILPGIKKTGTLYMLQSALKDSLKLTSALIPEILPLMNDSSLMPVMVPVINDLIDSSLLPVSMVNKYKNVFFKTVEKILVRDMPHDDMDNNGWEYRAWISLVQKFKGADVLALINKLQGSSSESISYLSLLEAAKKKLPLSKLAIDKLAADDYYRKDIYTMLNENNKLSLFPPAWLNQRSIFQSQLYNSLQEDLSIEKLEYVGERIRSVEGQKLKFYLFKVYLEEGDPVLGIIGGLPAASKDVSIEAPYEGQADDSYNSSLIGTQLDDFIMKSVTPYESSKK
jgi:uncharacterized protein YbaP (TraB family)